MSEKKTFALILTLCAAFLTCLVFIITDGYGGADSFQHYMISRYSWKHPQLLLNHWGKPVFTLLSSPFSQLGYKGLFVFNMLATLLSAVLVYRISKLLHAGAAPLSVVFFMAMPMAVLVTLSGLTEPLFGLVLVASVWLFSRKQYLFSVLLLSFLPLVRSEGFVVFPVFALALVLAKQWKYIPLFVAGALLYSVAGYFVFDDFLWLIHRSPYKMQTGLYGSGPWYHFLLASRYIFGWPLVLLILIGLWLYVPKNSAWVNDRNNLLRLLIAGSFAAYFLAHSYVWWKGTGSSLGLERVIAGVCPLAAIIAFDGFSFIAAKTEKFFSKVWILLLLFIAIIKSSYGVLSVNTRQDVEAQVMHRVADWIKSKPELTNQRLFYYNPHIAFLLDKDVFDRAQVEQLWGLIDENHPLLWLKDGEYLVWDAHFGSNEGGTAIDKLLHKPDVKILNHFYPDEQRYVLGGYNYEVFVFGKQSGWKDTLTEIIPDSASALGFLKNKNFEVTQQQEYVDVIENDFSALSKSALVYLDVEIKYPAEKTLDKDGLVFVLDMSCKGNVLKYDATDISYAQQENESKVIRKRYLLPPLTSECGRVKTFFWNIAKTDLNNISVNMKVIHVAQNP